MPPVSCGAGNGERKAYLLGNLHTWKTQNVSGVSSLHCGNEWCSGSDASSLQQRLERG